MTFKYRWQLGYPFSREFSQRLCSTITILFEFKFKFTFTILFEFKKVQDQDQIGFGFNSQIRRYLTLGL